jgi:hypothetical protein
MRSGELSDAVNADNPVKALRALRDPRFTRLLDQATEDLLDACEGSDLILHHPGATIGSFYARAAGVPAYIASPFPLTPTSEYPSLLFARYPLPRVANRLTHSLFLRRISLHFWMPATRRLMPDSAAWGTPGKPGKWVGCCWKRLGLPAGGW